MGLESFPPAVTDSLRQAIPATLADEGAATGPELARRLDAHPVAVERRCDRLLRAGLLCRTTGGAYAVTDQYLTRRASD